MRRVTHHSGLYNNFIDDTYNLNNSLPFPFPLLFNFDCSWLPAPFFQRIENTIVILSPVKGFFSFSVLSLKREENLSPFFYFPFFEFFFLFFIFSQKCVLRMRERERDEGRMRGEFYVFSFDCSIKSEIKR